MSAMIIEALAKISFSIPAIENAKILYVNQKTDVARDKTRSTFSFFIYNATVAAKHAKKGRMSTGD